MRKLLLTTLLLVGYQITSSAQFINNLRIAPPNPSSNDSIYLIASCYFQSGDCSQKTLNYSIINDTIDCDAIHCIGLLSYICYDEDTFSIGQLPAGNYNFRYFVNAGFGMNPCTPGIVPGPSDYLNFTVTTTSGIANTSYQEIVMGPNPCTEFIDIKCLGNEEKEVFILDRTGRVCVQQLNTGNNIHLRTDELAPGIYLIKIQSKLRIYQLKLFYKK